MKKKIVLLPLDERPCNLIFPQKLFSKEDIEIVVPNKLGNKKEPADLRVIREFLLKECVDADGLILSMDMLIYGGLIPSRLHQSNKEHLLERMELLKEIRSYNKKMLIYAFQVVMRCPNYSSNDEEPDYYEICGKEIHDIGELLDKGRHGEGNSKLLAQKMSEINVTYLNDYVSRRELNRYMNVETLQYLRDGFLDALVIPQDDSAPYGYAAMDQKCIREKISEYGMENKVLIYPGADEVEMTLISRMINTINGKKPKVYIKYLSEKSKNIIPLYEGMTLSSTVKYHVISAGCQITESYESADLILIITAPADYMKEASCQPAEIPEYYAERNLVEMVDFIKDRVSEGKKVTIADNAYANGGDLEILRLLNANNLLMDVAGYAGWNTSANTIGTAIAQGIDALYFGNVEQHNSFIVERYLEDCGYCGKIRGEVTSILPIGMNYFDVKEKEGQVSKMVNERLYGFLEEYLSSICDQVKIEKVCMPWRRMFEIELHVSYHQEGNESR